MTVVEYTNKGRRQDNQDYLKSCSLRQGAAVYVVADGMGGYACGDVAAKIVSESIVDFVAEHIGRMSSGQLLTEAFGFANESLYISRLGIGVKEMGCVVVALLVVDDMAYMAWIGDSRIYFFRNGEEIYRTEDHSMVVELSKIRTLSQEDNDRYSAIVTRALMGEDDDVKPSLMKAEIRGGDVLVLCSDGLHKQWPMWQVAFLPGEELIETLDANSNMMDDNFTFIRVKI